MHESATNSSLQIIPEEIAEVVNCFNDKTDKVFADGLHIAGERFVLTKVDEEEKGDKVVLARKVCSIIVFQYKIPTLEHHSIEPLKINDQADAETPNRAERASSPHNPNSPS